MVMLMMPGSMEVAGDLVVIRIQDTDVMIKAVECYWQGKLNELSTWCVEKLVCRDSVRMTTEYWFRM